MTRIIIDTLSYGDPRIKEASERMKQLIQELAIRRWKRMNRELAIAQRPGWFGSIEWRFPTWRSCKRLFNWAVACSTDFARRFPPIVGRGRGVVMNAAVSLRDTLLWLQGRDGEVDPKALRILNAGQARRYSVD